MADEQKTVAAEEVAVSEAAPQKSGISEQKLEVVIAILLGVTAILMAWAGWISSLHGGNQATNYTQSNNLSAMGNSMYNEAAQYYMQDMLLWNTIYDYAFDAEIAAQYEDVIYMKSSIFPAGSGVVELPINVKSHAPFINVQFRTVMPNGSYPLEEADLAGEMKVIIVGTDRIAAGAVDGKNFTELILYLFRLEIIKNRGQNNTRVIKEVETYG